MYTISKGTITTPEVIKAAILENEKKRPYYQKRDEYFKGEHSILVRKKSVLHKNSKVIVNHARYITKIFVGYLLGKPVDYKVQDGDLTKVLEQYKEKNIKIVDHQIAVGLSKFGVMYDYTYVLKDGKLRTRKIDPLNAIIVYDDTMEHEPIFVSHNVS